MEDPATIEDALLIMGSQKNVLEFDRWRMLSIILREMCLQNGIDIQQDIDIPEESLAK